MAEPDRIRTLDFVRGIAVMGILAMNIIAFAMPEPAYFNPLAWGQEGAADLWVWAAAFILIDGKMRGLFSMLFGASMLLMYERGGAAAEDAGAAHRRRMAWLLAFGLVHYFLVWDGDILTMYALCGLLGLVLLHAGERGLIRAAALLMLGGIAIYAALVWSMAGTIAEGSGSDYRALIDLLGGPGSAPAMAKEVALFGGGSYGQIVAHRLADWTGPLDLVTVFGLETLGLMALGMALLRNGFLTGGWSAAQYRRFALIGYAIGLPPLILLAVWVWRGGFGPLDTITATILWATPFRIAVMLGHAALAIWAFKALAGSPAAVRVEAAGRMAFSNYLGTSLVMTILFYGFGVGLFGQLSRWQAYLLCIPAWIGMLAWSKPWLQRYRYGPMEWAWRSLARGRFEKIALDRL